MSTAREAILTRLMARQAGSAALPDRRADRVAWDRQLGLPADAEALMTMFVARARATSATVTEARSLQDFRAWALGRSELLQTPCTLLPDPLLAPVAVAGRFDIAANSPRGDERPVLSRARAGVAETGTLLFASGPGRSASAPFLASVQLAVLAGSDLVATYEQAIDRIRADDFPPRHVTFVTGPSRTADIEQTLVVGAHGPARLDIAVLHYA
jgi:L-lactate dehydrogenase complex protein LldG